MNTHSTSATSRREFLKQTSAFAATSALAGIALPHVHAAENHTLQLALVGCGDGKPAAHFNATDITGAAFGRTLALKDAASGEARRLESYRGKVLVLFFGFAQRTRHRRAEPVARMQHHRQRRPKRTKRHRQQTL